MRYKITYKYNIHFPDPREPIVEIRKMEIEVKDGKQLSEELKNFEARGCREVIKVEKMKKIKEQNLYIPYDLCLKMRDLGFDWVTFDCYWIPDKNGFGFWKQHIKAPKILYDQAFAWFREKGFECNIESYYDIFISKRIGYLYSIEVIENDMRAFTYNDDNCFDTYKEARLDALTKLIKLYEEDKK